MKALAFKVSFFESLFKVHYTKAFKLSYPTLLPSSILGLIGNICGYDRKEVLKELGDFHFGAIFLKGYYTEENITFIQFKKETGGRLRSGVIKSQVYNDSKHIIIVAGEERDLKEKIISRIKTLKADTQMDEYGEWKLIKAHRYPYGGWNDFFIKDIRILNGFLEIEKRDKVKGYVPSSLVKSVQNDAEIDVLPVRYKNKMEYFVFVKKGYVLLKEEVNTVLEVPIYQISDFNYL